jgi:hypothetical protein
VTVEDRFGRLTLLAAIDGRRALWRCNCGVQKVIRIDGVKSGGVVSCGCFNRELRTKHGHLAVGSPTKRLYRCWLSMLARCYNRKNKSFDRYGGRGIFVCDRWRLSFDAFLEDVGFPPGPAYSLDRCDNAKGYELRNVRWALPEAQCRNRRSNRRLVFGGEERTLTEWAERCGVKPATLWRRLESGWAMERALQPVR